MTRINVYQYPEAEAYDEEPTVAGWFDPAAASRYDEGTRWDGSNHVSLVTGSQWDHQTLYRTKGGRWVLNCWSQRQGHAQTYQFVDDQRARDWMIRCEYPSEQIAEIFGEELPAERGPGRPEIGPAFSIRFPAELVARLDAEAAERETSRADVIRWAVDKALADIGQR